MGCACGNKRKSQQFIWWLNESVPPVIYDTELQAKAKVLRKGGNYKPYDPTKPLAAQFGG